MDRAHWPLLYSEGGTTIAAMVESVVAALEVKSSIDASEIENIFTKTNGLHSLRLEPPENGRQVAVTAFGYQCTNPLLAFFDFASASTQNPSGAPREICLLTDGVLCHGVLQGNRIMPVFQATDESIPVFLETGKDALLLWTYLLCRWLEEGSERANLFLRYCENIYLEMRASYFETDFLAAIRSNAAQRDRARTHFKRPGDVLFERLYRSARAELGLQGGD